MDVVDHAKNDPKLSHGVFSANGYALCLCWRLCSPLTAMQLYLLSKFLETVLRYGGLCGQSVVTFPQE